MAKKYLIVTFFLVLVVYFSIKISVDLANAEDSGASILAVFILLATPVIMWKGVQGICNIGCKATK